MRQSSYDMTKTIGWFFSVFRMNQRTVTEAMVKAYGGRGPYARCKVGEVVQNRLFDKMETNDADYNLLYERHWNSYLADFICPSQSTFIDEEIKAVEKWLDALNKVDKSHWEKRENLEICIGYHGWLVKKKKENVLISGNEPVPIKNQPQLEETNQLKQERYDTFESLFKLDYRESIPEFIQLLKIVEKPLIDTEGKYVEGRLKGGFVIFWEDLKDNGVVHGKVPRLRLAALFNEKFIGLDISNGMFSQNNDTAKKLYDFNSDIRAIKIDLRINH